MKIALLWSRGGLLVAGVLAAVFVGVRPAQAIIRSFIIDPSLSEITVSGTVTRSGLGTFPVQEQQPGSLTTDYTGSIRVDVGTDTIQFIGGSVIDANVSGNWTPVPGGGAGTAPADYGGFVNLLLAEGNFAGRDFIADLTSGVLSIDGNDHFDLSSTTVTFTSGDIAYRVTGLVSQSGQESIVGETGSLTGMGTLATPPSVSTLTLPINSTLTSQIDADTSVNLVFTGQLVARVVDGDFDADGDVDGADFVAWQTNFPKASGATLAQGDADSDGDVDGADFVVWQTNFPYSPSPGVSPLPEPGGIILFAIGAALLARTFVRRN